ncbi:MAG: exodeoxyribonuclease VII small subunit [Verrucomicrobiales bacterium]|jgi:exodeoxyribonuclease VII small subunit|nr:exodeoxyribonuclease VII small subunit [Verrucomicrobiales bacterium]
MAKSKDNLTFEDAVARLEEIVARMESAQLPLDSIIGNYEEGMKLLAFCGEKLTAAEQKIELLTRDQTGKVRRSELDADGANAKVAAPPLTVREKTDGPEISLF